jgi:molecular chaperone GrpE (heat shock protein)
MVKLKTKSPKSAKKDANTKQGAKVANTSSANPKDVDLQGQLARALADYANLQKRVDKEKEEIWRLMLVRFVSKVLPVYDMLLNAQSHLGDPGIAITIEEFTKILNEDGVEKIGIQVGDNFDQDYCEATDTESASDKNMKGKVAKVLMQGFRIKDGPVIRPAKVTVYN